MPGLSFRAQRNLEIENWASSVSFEASATCREASLSVHTSWSLAFGRQLNKLI